MQERWFDVTGADGVRLRVRDVAGPAREASGLLLHHGLASSQRIWDLMLPRLAHRFRVVTYDARGHGLSGKPSSGYGFPHLVEDAAAVIRAARCCAVRWSSATRGAPWSRSNSPWRAPVVSGSRWSTAGSRRPAIADRWADFKSRLAPPMLDGLPLGGVPEGMRGSRPCR